MRRFGPVAIEHGWPAIGLSNAPALDELLEDAIIGPLENGNVTVCTFQVAFGFLCMAFQFLGGPLWKPPASILRMPA